MAEQRSHGFAIRSACRGCGATEVRVTWTLIDASEHPEIVQQIRQGRLNRSECKKCGRVEGVTAPLMLFSPGRFRPLLFSPQPGGDTPSQVPKWILDAARKTLGAVETPGSTINEKSKNDSIARLRRILGNEWNEKWLERIRLVPRPALRPTVDGDKIFSDPKDELEDALGAFQQTASRVEARAVLEAYPVLLTDTALNWYEQTIAAGGKRVDQDQQRLDLIERCRRAGIPGAFGELATILTEAAEKLVTPADLPKQTALFRHALELVDRDDGPRWALLQIHLANHLMLDLTGGRGRRVEEAIRAYRLALDGLEGLKNQSAFGQAWAAAAVCLGNALVDDAPGDQTANLEDAIGYFQGAMQIRTRDQYPAQWAIVMRDLAIAWRVRREGSKTDNLQRALQVCREALEVLSPKETPVEWSMVQDTLGTVRSELAKTDANPLQHVTEAVNCFRSALQTLSIQTDPQHRAAVLINLGAALDERSRLTPDTASKDFEDAVVAYRQSLAIFTEAGDLLAQARVLNNLAAAYKHRSIGVEDLETAAGYYDQALDRVSMEDCPEDHRRMSGDLGQIYFRLQRWPQAAECYRKAVEAADVLYRGSLLVASKQSELAMTRDLHHRATYAIARIGEFGESAMEAAVMIERGRSRILGEALARDRAELERLRAHDRESGSIPGPSVEYREAAETLKQLESAERSRTQIPGESLREELRKHRLILRSVVGRVRNLPGFEKFLMEPDFDEICSAVLSGLPLVYVVTTVAGSLAIMVKRQGDSVTAEVVWGDSLNLDQITSLLSQNETDSISDRLTQRLDELLPLVGKALISPLAARLKAAGAEGVTFVPCGILGLIPLHACPYDSGGQSAILLDHFDVTYAPSARFLLAARKMIKSNLTRPALAGIANPLPHPSELRFAQMELEQVARFFPSGAQQTRYGTEARGEIVEQILQGASYVHFACHGRFEPAEPLDSCLQLANGELLTLRKILTSPPYHDLRLVVLSACETAQIELEHLPDEFIGLPAGFLSAGAAAVVGTLWPVDDISTALLMRKFYEFHLAGDPKHQLAPMPPSRALRHAQLWLRSVTSDDLFQFFDSHRTPESAAALPMLAEVAAAGTVQFGLDDPGRCRYGESMHHWAPFVFVGV